MVVEGIKLRTLAKGLAWRLALSTLRTSQKGYVWLLGAAGGVLCETNTASFHHNHRSGSIDLVLSKFLGISNGLTKRSAFVC